jgi:hypothetical protein
MSLVKDKGKLVNSGALRIAEPMMATTAMAITIAAVCNI